MSLETWHNYGYGINVSAIKTDADRLRAFIASQPAIRKVILDWEKTARVIEDNNIAESIYAKESFTNICELYDDFGDFCEIDGFAGIIQMVISESAGFSLVACEDSNTDDNFVIIPPRYPWDSNTAYFAIKSEDDAKAIFEKNLALLTDQTLDELDWGEQEVEGFA